MKIELTPEDQHLLKTATPGQKHYLMRRSELRAAGPEALKRLLLVAQSDTNEYDIQLRRAVAYFILGTCNRYLFPYDLTNFSLLYENEKIYNDSLAVKSIIREITHGREGMAELMTELRPQFEAIKERLRAEGWYREAEKKFWEKLSVIREKRMAAFDK